MDTDFTGTVTLTGASPGFLSGSTTVAAVAGVATFASVRYDVVADGDPFSLVASAVGLTPTSSVALTGSILPAPTLTAVPAASYPSVRNKSPVLTWSSVPAAVSYQLDLGLAPSCESVANDLAVAGTSYHLAAGLADGSYCWRVRSVGSTGNCSSWSAGSTFTTIPTFSQWRLLLLVLCMARMWYWRRRRSCASRWRGPQVDVRK